VTLSFIVVQGSRKERSFDKYREKMIEVKY